MTARAGQGSTPWRRLGTDRLVGRSGSRRPGGGHGGVVAQQPRPVSSSAAAQLTKWPRRVLRGERTPVRTRGRAPHPAGRRTRPLPGAIHPLGASVTTRRFFCLGDFAP